MSSRLPYRARRLALECLEDRAVPAIVVDYSVTQQWSGGFQGQVQLVNNGPSTVSFDQLQFNLGSSITSIFNAKLVSHAGNQYTVTNAGWDAAIPAGGSVTFAFTASGSSTAALDFVFSGTPATPPAGNNGQVTFKSTGDWGTGMNGQFTLTNNGTSLLNNWQLGFDFAGPINSLWNGTVLSHVGNHYVVGPTAWNSSLPPGGSITVGFTAGQGGLTPTNMVLGVAGATPPANQPPTAGPDNAGDVSGKAVKIAVLANASDPDGDPLTVSGVGKPAHGRVVINKDNTVTYTADAGYVGNDGFSYTVSDGRGGTATGHVTVSVTAPVVATPWPAQVFAPYVDATLYPTYDFASAAKAQGTRFFTLAFITADSQNKPAWGGFDSYALNGTDFDKAMRTQITALRALGGDVAVSFGGAAGRDLAEAITDVHALTDAYRSVIRAYGLTHIDFDIEGAALADHAAIDRRSQAIATLEQEAQAAGRELNVRFTLPALPAGLTADGLYVLQSAKHFGARVDLVNIMAMDYGNDAAPNPAGHMGDYAIQAATSLFNQLTTLYGTSKTDAQRWAMIGVTPMIGMNDVTNEVFDQQAARELEAWAAQHHIGMLSMWSINRDKENSAGAISYVDLTSSSLVQSPYEFCSIFGAFTS